MNLDQIHSIYFVGVGGIGMSALARFFKDQGKAVYGYDRVRTQLTEKLESEGIEITYTDSIDAIHEDFLFQPLDRAWVIYTPAIPKTNVILGYFNQYGYLVSKRSEALSEVTAEQKTIAIAGTHGKTTTSAMVAHMLTHCDVPVNAFLGGIANNFNSNIVLHPEAQYTVVEADEYDRSFLRLKPFISVVTSVDADHLDIYADKADFHKTFEQFLSLTSPDGLISLQEQVSMDHPKAKRFGISENDLEIAASHLRVEEGNFVYSVYENGEFKAELSSPYPGNHNVQNTLAAISIARFLGLEYDKIKGAVASFKGVKRRFEYQIKRDDLVFIDDYAHHPTEISACVGSVKTLFPEKRITGVFQPHLYSRTRDFADDFATSLEELNDLILMEIYPAREEPIEGVNSEMLFDKIRMVNKKLCDRAELVDEVARLKPEVLLTMGAGDIDKMIEPLKKALDDKDE